MKKIAIALVLLVGLFGLTSCSSPGYQTISNEELQAMLDNESYQFVDVRTSTEFYEERIPGFTYNIDYYQLEDNMDALDKLDKSIPVVIMCNSGNRSVSASNIFVDEGFEVVYNLENGIQGWNGETE
jgi:rhodanese-related sulfurtransferase